MSETALGGEGKGEPVGDGQVSTGTRRTLFEVEQEKRWRIWALFGLLLALAFATAWVGCLIVALVLGASFVVALVYWGLAQIGARDRLLQAMHCLPLDPGDRYHERLANIVE